MNKTSAKYELTPKGFLIGALGEAAGEEVYTALQAYCFRTGYNAIYLLDGTFITVETK